MYGTTFSPVEAWDFDNAVLDFADWFEARTNEQKIVPDRGLKPKKGQTVGAKYETLNQIFALYGTTAARGGAYMPDGWADVAPDLDTLQRNLEAASVAALEGLDDGL